MPVVSFAMLGILARVVVAATMLADTEGWVDRKKDRVVHLFS
jgi:hypothetical protein